jgi:16S rRNA G527 N7-methylase RsmG
MLELEKYKNNINNLFAITDLTEIETKSIIDCLEPFDYFKAH